MKSLLAIATDFALKKIGMGTEAHVRARQKSVWKVQARHASVASKHASKAGQDARIDLQALAWFAIAPGNRDGGDLDSLYIALVGAGSQMQRKNVGACATTLVEKGLLVHVAHGRYLVKPGTELPRLKRKGKQSAKRVITRFAIDCPEGGDLNDLGDAMEAINGCTRYSVTSFASQQTKKGRLQRIGYGRYRANYTLDDPVEQGGSKERVRYLAMVPVAAIFAADRPHGGSLVDLRAALTNSGVVVELRDVFAYAHEMVKWGLLLRAQRGKYMATADKNIDPELPPKTPEDQTVRFRAAQFFREDYPDGGGIDELHAALTTAGADVQRASVATYAAGMIALGYLERIEYGRYRAVPLVEVEEEENEPTLNP